MDMGVRLIKKRRKRRLQEPSVLYLAEPNLRLNGGISYIVKKRRLQEPSVLYLAEPNLRLNGGISYIVKENAV